jgi:uncharacterized protein (TIGR02611 family)
MGFAQRIRDNLTEHRAAHSERHLLFRILFAMAGSAVLLAGIVMLVTPGPAFILIPLGLAMLALEFTWAERLLDRALHHAESAQRKAAESSPAERILGVLAGLLVFAAALAAWLTWEIPLIPG